MKEKKTNAIIVRPAEVLRPVPALNPEAWIERIVEKKMSEIAEKRPASAIFEPFFRSRAITTEIKRRQTIAEQRKWSLYYEKYGCLLCETTDRPHTALGMCCECYGRTKDRLSRLLKEAEAERRPRKTAKNTETADAAERESKPLRHASWCTVCSHPKRQQIEQDYVNAGHIYGAIREIARKYGLKGTLGIYRHARALGLNALRNLGT